MSIEDKKENYFAVYFQMIGEGWNENAVKDIKTKKAFDFSKAFFD